MPPTGTWIRMGLAGVAISVGGPALVYYVSPTEEELFKKYNPELQRRSLENRMQKQEDFDKFVKHLKDYSKDDKNIWIAADQAEQKRQAAARQKILPARSSIGDEMKKQRAEMSPTFSETSIQDGSTPALPQKKWFWSS